MKKVFFVILSLIMVLGLTSKNTNAQTVSDFQNLTLAPDSYWNGSDLSGGFISGAYNFINVYDTTFLSWSGFAYSNMKDTITATYSNQYSCIKGKGVMGSSNYGISYVYAEPIAKVNNQTTNGYAKGMYLTNSTYAYMSILNGDPYSKKFGGVSGNDTDWFKLSIIGYHYPQAPDTIPFYLADYRFANNALDYIIKEWTWIDLSSFGKIDSIGFLLSSTDNSTWGMNTPAYFCIDNLTIDYAPFVSNPLPNIIFNETHLSQSMSIANVFDDIDSPSLTLEYSIAKVSDTNKIHALLNGLNLDISNAYPLLLKSYVDYNEYVVLSCQSNVLIAYDTVFVNAHIFHDVVNLLNQENQINIYPNPITSILYIKGIENGDEVEVVNAEGSIMMKPVLLKSSEIDVSALVPGLYIIKLIRNNSIVTKRFIKN
ncbi:MAG: DUF4465 domain-containing protein [Bacteroidota bacterium]